MESYNRNFPNCPTLTTASGLGYAWLAPLITGVIEGQTKVSGEATDTFAHQQAVIAGHRAAAQTQETVTKVATIGGIVLFLGLGTWAVYRLTK